jgi:hypothetical protein
MPRQCATQPTPSYLKVALAPTASTASFRVRFGTPNRVPLGPTHLPSAYSAAQGGWSLRSGRRLASSCDCVDQSSTWLGRNHCTQICAPRRRCSSGCKPDACDAALLVPVSYLHDSAALPEFIVGGRRSLNRNQDWFGDFVTGASFACGALFVPPSGAYHVSLPSQAITHITMPAGDSKPLLDGKEEKSEAADRADVHELRIFENVSTIFDPTTACFMPFSHCIPCGVSCSAP